MKNRLISIFLFCAFICSFIGTAAAAEENKITISADKQFVLKGEEVTYTLSGVLSNIKGIQLKLVYDAQIASYIENSMDFPINSFTDYYGGSENKGELTIAFALDEAADFNGAAASFKMRAVKNGNIGLRAANILATDGGGNVISVDCGVDNAEIVSKYNVEFNACANTSSVNIGDEISYDINISDIRVKGMQYSVVYDDRYFVLDEVFAASKYDTEKNKIIIKREGNKINCFYYAEEESVLSGKLMTLKFRARYAEETVKDAEPIKVTDFKAAGGENDFAYSSVCAPVSIEKTDKISMEFKADKLTAGEGELVSYDIDMKGMAQYEGVQTTLHYDNSKLEFVSIKSPDYNTSGYVSYNTSSAGIIKIIFAATDDNKLPNGYLGTAVFKVKPQTKSGYADMRIGAVKASADGNSMADADYYCSVDEIFTYKGQKINITGTPDDTIAVSGEDLTYTFKVSDLNNFKGGSFVLGYDSDVLEFVSLENDAFDTAYLKIIKETEPGMIQGMIAYKDNYTGLGGEFKVRFKVKAVTELINPDIHFRNFVSDDYFTFDVGMVDVYPTDPAQETINAIASIGEVTLESKAVIDYARSLYEMLAPEFRGRVTNLDDLLNAEAKYRELYDALPIFSCVVRGENVIVTQNKPCDEALKLYIAEYEDNGAMSGVEVYDINGSEVYTRAGNTNNIKCFIWRGDMSVYENVGYSYE